MRYSLKEKACKYILFLCLLLGYNLARAQSNSPSTVPGNKARDTSMNKSNTTKWKDEEARIYYKKLDSRHVYYPDTTLHTFQRNQFTQPWGQDMGNLGSPVYNLMFTPEDRMGPSLGYHVSDVYRFNIDSLNYYNTTRPYAVFNYLLGSKLEQTAGLMITENVKPNWNIAVGYHKINSPGFYKVERNNHDNAYVTTNFKSLDKHYTLNAAMVYNKEQHDENGGIVNDSELLMPIYSDRRTVDAAYQSDAYSTTRSSVSNVQRDFTFMVQHGYTWGNMDTTYNSDSTQYTYSLRPRFSITQKLELSTEKHSFKDLTPDSARYINLFTQSFANTGNGYYNTAGGDSVFTQQEWFWVDHKLMLNGFLGKAESPLEFSVGLGTRYDEFISKPVSNIIVDSLPKLYYSTGLDRSSLVSNYLAGEIKKEALHAGEWAYIVNTKFIFTGNDAGNFLLNASISKNLPHIIGSIVLGVQQAVNTAPYSYTNYENVYAKNFYTFNKESVSDAYVTLESPRLRLSAGFKDYAIGNYIYVNESEVPAQYSPTFTMTQLWVRKVFKAGNFFLDNELAYQQIPGNAPLNIPALMGRHQLSYERSLFHARLRIAAGIETRYTTNYKPAGYDAVLNKFFYQNSITVSNVPQEAIFLNFRIKRFRAFVMGDNLQQIFSRNTILYTGSPVYNFNRIATPYTSVYAAADALIRFGFTWTMVD